MRTDSKKVTSSFLVLLVFCVAQLGCEGRPPIGGDTPVTASRLSGCELTHVHDDLSWDFTDQSVSIQSTGKSIPADLAEQLLGMSTNAKLIKANWTLNESAGVLQLSSMEVNGEALEVEQKANIAIQPAGHIRVNLGARQYNIRKDSATSAKLP